MIGDGSATRQDKTGQGRGQGSGPTEVDLLVELVGLESFGNTWEKLIGMQLSGLVPIEALFTQDGLERAVPAVSDM